LKVKSQQAIYKNVEYIQFPEKIGILSNEYHVQIKCACKKMGRQE
jgi:hypothetical protein